MTLLVRDEAELVEANLEHHFSEGVDFVIATDNGSVDRTPRILRKYARRGRVQLISEPGRTYRQHAWVTTMARSAATDHAADWIINNDADEFWLPLDRSSTVKGELSRLAPSVGSVVVPRYNLLVRPPDGRPWYERMTVRVSTPLHHPGYAEGELPPKTCHRADPAIVIRQGNHEIESQLLGPAADVVPLEILHVPIRSKEQFEHGIVTLGEAYAANTELPLETGAHRRRLYTEHQAGGFDARWAGIALDDREIRAGLDDGRFVEDRRLASTLPALLRGPSSRRRRHR